jgi:tRNA (guanine37-N1)-methyltransferase
MRIDVLTLFPGMFTGPMTESMLKRAADAKILDLRIHDLRPFGEGRHKSVDEKPYGGGAGMLMMCEPVVNAIEKVSDGGKPHRVYLSAAGKRLTQSKVESMAKKHDWLLLLCGHYEGVDQRVIDGWIDEEISIGDYVLTGGELPAMVLIDAVSRHIPGVLGKEASAHLDSFSKAYDRKKEFPQYTRPEDFRGMKVPQVLLSGNHAVIDKWRKDSLR